ncbi:MAG: hypothetical protein JXA13_01815 [Anaerolineales bacterium]|nr:hypothetical protein [Anaerolineales bacterium]
MTTILFVCTANRYRSPIAEACFQRELKNHPLDKDFKVASAGTWTETGLPAMPGAIKDAVRLGLDISQHRSQPITDILLHTTDMVIVMEQGQKEALQMEFPTQRQKIYLLSEVTTGIPYDIPDPMREDIKDDVAQEIMQLIQSGFNKIIGLSS